MPWRSAPAFRAGGGRLWAPPLLFGRRPPQSNYPPCTVPNPDYGPRLELRIYQGGISTVAPQRLASPLQSLPPILHRQIQNSVQSYSKGSRGLSVLPRGHCIFTAISTSLSLGWRQCGHRYAIRAGRNLPDKEFRYLRTVIVTAAVYWGFDQELLPLPHCSLYFVKSLFGSVTYWRVCSFASSAVASSSK